MWYDMISHPCLYLNSCQRSSEVQITCWGSSGTTKACGELDGKLFHNSMLKTEESCLPATLWHRKISQDILCAIFCGVSNNDALKLESRDMTTSDCDINQQLSNVVHVFLSLVVLFSWLPMLTRLMFFFNAELLYNWLGTWRLLHSQLDRRQWYHLIKHWWPWNQSPHLGPNCVQSPFKLKLPNHLL